jgi:hypothetical protein
MGIVARGQLLPHRCIARGIPAALVLGKLRLHLLNLRVKARALRRRGIEQKELAPVAAEPTRISDRAIEFGALFLRSAAIVIRIRLAAFAERGDPRRKFSATERLGRGRTGEEDEARAAHGYPQAGAKTRE